MWVIIIIAPIFWNSNASGLLIFKVRPAEAKEVAKEEELAKLADQNQSNPFSQNLFWCCFKHKKNMIQVRVSKIYHWINCDYICLSFDLSQDLIITALVVSRKAKQVFSLFSISKQSWDQPVNLDFVFWKENGMISEQYNLNTDESWPCKCSAIS